MTTWAQLLDDYEATIVALESAAASGDEPPAGAWQAPAEAPADEPTTEDHERFSQLQLRAAACASQLQASLATAENDLHNVRRTGAAARAYAGVDQLTG